MTDTIYFIGKPGDELPDDFHNKLEFLEKKRKFQFLDIKSLELEPPDNIVSVARFYVQKMCEAFAKGKAHIEWGWPERRKTIEYAGDDGSNIFPPSPEWLIPFPQIYTLPNWMFPIFREIIEFLEFNKNFGAGRYEGYYASTNWPPNVLVHLKILEATRKIYENTPEFTVLNIIPSTELSPSLDTLHTQY